MTRSDAAEQSGRDEAWAVRLVHSLAVGPAARRRRWTPVGLGVFGASLALVVVGGLATDRLLSIPTLTGDAPRTVAALVLLLGGLALSAWCAGLFARARGTPVPVNPPSRLIQRGPYAWVRNPMLTGVFAALVGIGLLLRSASMVLLWTPAYLLLHVLELKWVEEPELERRFGVAYRAYRDAVPMFLPLPRLAAVRRLLPVCVLAAAAAALAGRLRFHRRYVGATLVMGDRRTFRVFRHLSLAGSPAPDRPALLFVRFRFARLPERWNRLLSLMPVPAIGGYPGFRAKVWMSGAGGWWQGVYEWQSVQAARSYRASLVFRTMERRAAPGTVSTAMVEGRRLGEWLEDRRGHSPKEAS
jgi:protein-S-isoprenylcysteine O-methyltransferase Ste14